MFYISHNNDDYIDQNYNKRRRGSPLVLVGWDQMMAEHRLVGWWVMMDNDNDRWMIMDGRG